LAQVPTVTCGASAVVPPGAPHGTRRNRRRRGAGSPTEQLDQTLSEVDYHFRIGSVAKSFLSTMVLQLVGEGRLGLDDPVGRPCPPSCRAMTGSLRCREVRSDRSKIDGVPGKCVQQVLNVPGRNVAIAGVEQHELADLEVVTCSAGAGGSALASATTSSGRECLGSTARGLATLTQQVGLAGLRSSSVRRPDVHWRCASRCPVLGAAGP
jgi:hypothetical protein